MCNWTTGWVVAIGWIVVNWEMPSMVTVILFLFLELFCYLSFFLVFVFYFIPMNSMNKERQLTKKRRHIKVVVKHKQFQCSFSYISQMLFSQKKKPFQLHDQTCFGNKKDIAWTQHMNKKGTCSCFTTTDIVVNKCIGMPFNRTLSQ